MSEIFVPEIKIINEEKPIKVKKPRKPLSDERKAQLRIQLATARLAKKNAKAKVVKTVEEPEPPTKPAPKPKKPKAKVVKEIPKVIKSNNEQELEDLKTELRMLKESNSLTEKNNIKKEIASIKERNKLPKIPEAPEPEPTPKPLEIPEFKKENYSTYKKSIWKQFED